MIGEVKKTTGGGDVEIVNGKIEQYKAGSGTIGPNTFVELVSNVSYGSDTINSTAINHPNNYYYAENVSNNKQIVAYFYSNSIYLYPFVGSTSLTMGSVTVKATSYTPLNIKIKKIAENKLFVLFHEYSGNTQYITGFIVDTTNNSLTIGTDVTIASGYQNSGYYGSGISIEQIENNKAFVTYRDPITRGLMGVICTISGTNITTGTPVEIQGANGLGVSLNAYSALMINGNIAVVYNDGSVGYCKVCTVSGTNITTGTRYSVSTHKGSNGQKRDAYDVVRLDDTHLFLHYVDDTTTGSSTYPMTNYGRIAVISGTEVSQGSEYSISAGWYNSANGGIFFGIARIFDNKVALFGDDINGQRKLYRVECNITGTSISVGSKINMNNTTNSIYEIGNNNFGVAYDNERTWVFHIAYSNGYKPSYFYINGQKYLTQASTKITGITKEEITTSTAGDVWVLNN